MCKLRGTLGLGFSSGAARGAGALPTPAVRKTADKLALSKLRCSSRWRPPRRSPSFGATLIYGLLH